MGIPIAQFTTSGEARISLHHGDLTRDRVDAIVNAANSHLAHGGGVAAAIVSRGGHEIQDESSEFVRRHGPVPVGHAAVTKAGKLHARIVIHAVGPQWGEGSEPAKLRSAAIEAFRLAVQYQLQSVALPAISSGIFGFPKAQCAEVLVDAAIEFFESHPVETLREIRFTIIDDETVAIFRDEFVKRFGKECVI